jgi:hypothetical protein
MHANVVVGSAGNAGRCMLGNPLSIAFVGWSYRTTGQGFRRRDEFVDEI